MSDEPRPKVTDSAAADQKGHEEGRVPIYLKVAYIIIAVWCVVYFWLYF